MRTFKKILFVEPPSLGKRTPERFAGCAYELYHFPDLANLYPFSVCARAGYEVDYIDAVIEKLKEKEFLCLVAKAKPDCLVMHSVILSKATDLYYIQALRRILPGANILLHGPEPTRVPEEYLYDDKVVVFRGECEKSMFGFIAKGLDQGTARLKEGKPVEYPPAEGLLSYDELPYPERAHAKIKKYTGSYYNPKFKLFPHTIMMTSRGCSYRCRYCVPNSLSFARQLEYFRTHDRKPAPLVASAEYVINEFKQIKTLGFRSVMIVDDQFLWSKARTLQICAGIKGLGIQWGCLSRADFLTDEEVVRAMADAGCVSVDIGVESFSQEVLNDIQKDLSVADIRASIGLLDKYAISPKLNIMIGVSALQTRKEIMDTVDVLKSMPVDYVMFSLATPFKGTCFYQLARTEGWLTDESDMIDPLGKSMVSFPNLTKKDLEALQKSAYRSFYLRPKFILQRVKNWANPANLIRDIKIGIRILR